MEPLYRKLQQKIKSQILSGVYRDGDLLPSESDLMKAHSSTRGTVRQDSKPQPARVLQKSRELRF